MLLKIARTSVLPPGERSGKCVLRATPATASLPFRQLPVADGLANSGGSTSSTGFPLVFYINHSHKVHHFRARSMVQTDRQTDRRTDRSIATCAPVAGLPHSNSFKNSAGFALPAVVARSSLDDTAMTSCFSHRPLGLMKRGARHSAGCLKHLLGSSVVPVLLAVDWQNSVSNRVRQSAAPAL